MTQKKMGRPPSKNPLTARIFIRVDEDTKMKLNKCTQKLDVTISDVVRKGINKVYDDLEK